MNQNEKKDKYEYAKIKYRYVAIYSGSTTDILYVDWICECEGMSGFNQFSQKIPSHNNHNGVSGQTWVIK